MHFRRLVCLLLGAWLAGSAMMALVATQNFRTVDRLLLDPNPAISQELRTMGHDVARMLLRWEAGEQNRILFEIWETAQLALGMAVFFVLLFGSTESKYSLFMSLAMLVIVIVERFLLTPMIVSLGRLIDFVPPSAHSVERIKFTVLHSGYAGTEVLKFLIGLILSVKLMIRSRRRSSQFAGDVNVVDKTYHRHVDR
jgi:hypothetical protein